MTEGKVQILGLRNFNSENPKDLRETFFKKGWRSDNVATLFAGIEKNITNIPEEERFNLFYTICQCVEAPGRQLTFQDAIPFDIDGMDMDPTKLDKYIEVICGAIKVHRSQVAVINSGHGLQVIVQTTHPITDVKQFEALRPNYKAVIGKINTALYNENLPGEADSSVWSPARLMRLPFTINRKGYKGLPDVACVLINAHMEPLDFDLVKESDIPIVEEAEQIAPQQLARYPEPDTKGVLEKCDFIKWCHEDPNSVEEQAWYAALSIVARLEDGKNLCHKMSEGHAQYSESDCDRKILQALNASGPRTCINIQQLSDKCFTCPNFEKVTSPILLQSEEHIKTKSNGFYDVVIKDGVPQKGKPNYDDLIKFFESRHKYKADDTTGAIFTYEDTHWVEWSGRKVEAFAYQAMSPKPASTVTAEFFKRLGMSNQVDSDWFNSKAQRKMNFRNGTLDLATNEFYKHKSVDGFLTVLSYDYNEEAGCPRFDAFMDEITQSNESMKDVLLEFAGYAFSGEKCKYGKALIMTGEGANGKSTFMDILADCAGENTYSAVSLGELGNEQARALTYGKLFNISEETPKKALLDSSHFKNMVTGGNMTYKVVYKPQFSGRSTTKLINSCNELPTSTDTTNGLYRRLIIAPFNASFYGKKRDINLAESLRKERSGILNRIIEGYRRLDKQGHFTTSEVIEAELTSYMKDNDLVMNFADAYLDITNSADDVTALDSLYSLFQTFSEEEGIGKFKVMHRKTVIRRLSARYPSLDKVQIRAGGKRYYALRGVKLLDYGIEETF